MVATRLHFKPNNTGYTRLFCGYSLERILPSIFIKIETINFQLKVPVSKSRSCYKQNASVL